MLVLVALVPQRLLHQQLVVLPLPLRHLKRRRRRRRRRKSLTMTWCVAPIPCHGRD